MLMLLATGMRWGEAAGLPVREVNLESGTVSIMQVLRKKNGRNRPATRERIAHRRAGRCREGAEADRILTVQLGRAADHSRLVPDHHQEVGVAGRRAT